MLRLLKKSFEKSFRAFSLLEVSIALCVSGIMMGSFISLWSTYNRLQKHQKTQANQEKIFKAIGVFFTEQGFLPCPADPSATSNFGVMRPYCPGILSQGLVPFRTLGLDESIAKDGYNRWFTYSMESKISYRNLIFLVSICQFFLQTLRQHTVSDGDMEDIAEALDKKDGIAILLVSHGPKGYGSFLGRGSLQRMASPGVVLSPCKTKNLDGDFSFCIKPKADEVGLFDDRIFWVTRRNFLMLYTNIGLRCTDKDYSPAGSQASSYRTNPATSSRFK
jgi:type II secretory pathway pseudopilin PulG